MKGTSKLLTGEYLSTLSAQQRTQVLADAQATRAFVAQQPDFTNPQIILRDIASPHIDAIQADPLFVQAFGQLQHQFCYVDPSGIIALQAWIEPRSDPVPSTENELLEFAFPRTWDVPAEVSFIQPSGPIQILSSNPAMQGLAMELEGPTGRVMLSAPKHLNLVQIIHFNGRFFLRNGYHRVSDAIAVGLREFPAIVINAFSPNDVALPGAEIFNIGYVLNLKRPPLVQDFHTNAALTTKVRERRYGVIISLDVKPINIGI